uniref:Uncharacterized protein n=1 Tax=Oryza glumipatula TaxID=40148 RepID=A0A0D9YWG2_9ORYZ
MSVYTTTSTSVSGDRDDAREDAGDGSGDKRLRAKQAAEEATCIARALAVSSDGPGRAPPGMGCAGRDACLPDALISFPDSLLGVDFVIPQCRMYYIITCIMVMDAQVLMSVPESAGI